MDLFINNGRVARFNRQVVSEWLREPESNALGTGSVIWRHTVTGVALDYYAERHLLSLQAVNELTRLL